MPSWCNRTPYLLAESCSMHVAIATAYNSAVEVGASNSRNRSEYNVQTQRTNLQVVYPRRHILRISFLKIGRFWIFIKRFIFNVTPFIIRSFG